jgi:hypothetical protein
LPCPCRGILPCLRAGQRAGVTWIEYFGFCSADFGLHGAMSWSLSNRNPLSPGIGPACGCSGACDRAQGATAGQRSMRAFGFTPANRWLASSIGLAAGCLKTSLRCCKTVRARMDRCVMLWRALEPASFLTGILLYSAPLLPGNLQIPRTRIQGDSQLATDNPR